MACVSKGLIVGGGIAGLAAANALRRIGVEIDVVEIGDEPAGASISISGRATDALAELGVYEECCASGRPFTAEMSSPVMLDAAGKPLGPAPARPERPDARVPVGVFRPVFARILGNAAKKLGARIEKGTSIEALEEHGDSVKVTLSSGERRGYDFVIGADGINSRVRSLIVPDAAEPEYAGQMSVRWMIPGPAVPGEGWYVAGEQGRLGFFHMPQQNLVYVPIVFSMPEKRLSQADLYELVKGLLGLYTAPAIVNLRQLLKPDSTFICRPFKWHLLQAPWFRGRTMLIGDAAHATTAHMGMGAGMALEDAVVLAKCIDAANSLEGAYQAFMERRFDRVRTVVETSLALSKIEQGGAPPGVGDYKTLISSAYGAIMKPY